MSKLLFPRVEHIHRFLAVSESVANLDLAVAERRLRIAGTETSDIYTPN
jgi:hypothetical protein